MDRVRALAPSFDHVRYAKDPWEANYGVPLRYYNQLYRGGGLIHGEELPPLDTWAMMHPQPHYWVLHPKNEGSKVKLTESRFEVISPHPRVEYNISFVEFLSFFRSI